MKNTIIIGGHQAVIQFDPEIGMFRGAFLGLNGGADFYSDSVADLIDEGETSLKVFFEMCEEKGVNPVRHFSDKFSGSDSRRSSCAGR